MRWEGDRCPVRTYVPLVCSTSAHACISESGREAERCAMLFSVSGRAIVSGRRYPESTSGLTRARRRGVAGDIVRTIARTARKGIAGLAVAHTREGREHNTARHALSADAPAAGVRAGYLEAMWRIENNSDRRRTTNAIVRDAM